MATYVNDLRLKEIGTGESSGTWGSETNTNLELIGEALGFGTEGITTNADTHTTTIADGSTDPGRAMYLKYTGTLDSACTITIAPNTISRMQFIENGTSGSQNIIISQGTGANITIPAGDTKAIYLDGAGSGAAVVDAYASLNVVDLKVEDDLTVTDDLIVNGDIDLEGSIDVNGTANLDVVDIDGAVDIASTLQVDGSITSSDGATITVNDNSVALSLISTDADASEGPGMVLYRNSSSPADNDVLAQIYIQGENDADQKVTYALIQGAIQDASDGTEDIKLSHRTMVAGTERERMTLLGTETVFNEDSVDLDFRVESNGNANMLFVDGGNDAVGIGTSTIDNDARLHIEHSAYPVINLDRSSVTGDGQHIGYINFQNNGDVYGRVAVYAEDVSDTDGEIQFQTQKDTTLATKMIIKSDGNVGIGTTSPTTQVTASKSANISQVAITSSSNATAWDATAAANAYYVTSENTTISAPSNAVEGAIISIEIAQGGTARTVAWNTVFEFAASTAPTVTATVNKTDIFAFRYNGSVWQEIGRSQNMAQT